MYMTKKLERPTDKGTKIIEHFVDLSKVPLPKIPKKVEDKKPGPGPGGKRFIPMERVK
jgi:hypothetical protein